MVILHHKVQEIPWQGRLWDKCIDLHGPPWRCPRGGPQGQSYGPKCQLYVSYNPIYRVYNPIEITSFN